MLLNELAAMITLFRAADVDAQEKALALVPELVDFVDNLPWSKKNRKATTFTIRVHYPDGTVSTDHIACRKEDLSETLAWYAELIEVPIDAVKVI